MSENTNSFPSSPHNIFIKERKSDIIHRGDNPKNNQAGSTMSNFFETQKSEVNSPRAKQIQSNKSFRLKKTKVVSSPNLSNRGFRFSLGRDELKSNGILGNMLSTPGPGHYNSQDFNDGLKYSFKQKHIDLGSNEFFQNNTQALKKKLEIPPLGMYELPGLDRFGYYTQSNFKNSCATLIADPQWTRFKVQKSPNPGPGQYEVVGGINAKGIYYVSQFKNQLGYRFGKKSIKYHQRLF